MPSPQAVERAVRVAAVAVGQVAVVALLAEPGCDDAVAADLALAGGVAAVAATPVAVVALLAARGADARRRRSEPGSCWQVGEQPSPSFVLPSSHCSRRRDDAVAAGGERAVRVAAVAVDQVAVVALLGTNFEVVTAHRPARSARQGAGPPGLGVATGVAAVAHSAVAVVALLARGDDAVAAGGHACSSHRSRRR